MNTGAGQEIDFEEVALAAHLRLGDWVQLLDHCDSDARPGDVANILHIDAKTGNVTFYVHRTDTVTSHFPSAMVVLCGADFASNEATTPKTKRTEYVRRGAA